MSKLAKALTAAAGNAGGDNLYVEDVFSTYLYTGNGSTQTITNGIALDGEGGMVWIKARNAANEPSIFDTERGPTKNLRPTSVAAEYTTAPTADFKSFDSSGFSLNGPVEYADVNILGSQLVSWTFRKAEKFFDVVTWTGDGTGLRQIQHNLNGTVGSIFGKATSTTSQWFVYHKDRTGTQVGILNGTNPFSDFDGTAYYRENSYQTSSEFGVGSQLNASGVTYVAYLFASDAGGFGDDGSESIIKCGSYTGNGSTDGPEIDLGFEPQWILMKTVDDPNDGHWYMVDVMRGMPVGSANNMLYANLSSAENGFSGAIPFAAPTANGFKVATADWGLNRSGYNYIYIAIRRPMKTPESGTEVYNADFYGSTEANNSNPIVRYYAGFPVDFTLFHDRTGGGNHQARARLTGANYLHTNLTDAEIANSSDVFGSNQGIQIESTTASELTRYIRHMFKRATGFFDVVAYTGDGLDGRTVDHNLKAVPELLIVKSRSSAYTWRVLYYDGATGLRLNLNDNSAATTATGSIWGNSSTFIPPTSTQFTVSNYSNVNLNNATFIAYLFATVAGVSKVGSYTGNGGSSVQQIDCGFSSGARFILIKDADGANDWYVWDSARGIVAGNDPYLRLNQTAAENPDYDWVDPYSAGFEVTTDATAAFRINVSGRKYIFLAIA